MTPEQDAFRDNVRKHVDSWRTMHRKSLLEFTETVFPGRSRYRWLTGILSEGSPRAVEGAKYHPELIRLHAFFGLEWGDLWDPAQSDSLTTRFRALLEGVPRTASGDRLRQAISDQVETWRSAVQAINEDGLRPQPHATVSEQPAMPGDFEAFGADTEEWTSFSLDKGEDLRRG